MSPRLLLCVAGLCVTPAAAQTIITGGNLTTQTWTVQGSPYILQGDITVAAGQTLTINPGVSVQVAASDMQGGGVDPARVEIRIAGTVLSQGTQANPVSIVAQNGVSGSWYGIRFENTASASSITYTTVSGARRAFTSFAPFGAVSIANVNAIGFTELGLDIRSGNPIVTDAWFAGAAGAQFGIDIGTDATANLLRCTIAQCATGLRTGSVLFNFATGLNISGFSQNGVEINAGTPLLDRLWITGNLGTSAGVSVAGNGGATIRNAFITSCGTGVRTAATGPTNVQFSTIHANAVGGVHFLAGSGGVANSIVSNNGAFGIQAGATSIPQIRNTDVFNPGGQNYIGTSCFSGCISADPLYRSGSAPLLSNASPCIDAADPSGPPDYFGTPRPQEGNNIPGALSDMGVHEVICYANCDLSTQPPALNVADFTCFLQAYAAGTPYANCDLSTTPPTLNVADFTCFLQRYAAGCP
jgi:hypothetical protein